MSHQSALISQDIDAYLYQHENKQLLRLLTCGSVDDGKSTLIGRLLHDSNMVYEDHLSAIRSDTKKHGTTEDSVDLSLLTDGLQAEREQGITIDVAYRYFSTEKRKFIIADTPGHEQYTRNMATGASTCDLAVILIDARHGVMTQTRRHSYIASLLGIKHIVVAINKMDLVDYDENVYEQIKDNYTRFSESLNLSDIHFIPISALKGDNVVKPSTNMPWYDGATLMHILESVEISTDKNVTDFRFPVQYVNRPNLNFRGYCGTVEAGVISPGDEVVVLPSGKVNTVERIVTYDGDLETAFVGQAVTLVLKDELDISRGDVLVRKDTNASVTNNLQANLIWMAEAPLQTERSYLFKFASKSTFGRITNIHHKINVNTQEPESVINLELNSIAVANIELEQLTVMDSYDQSTGIGAFIVIDRLTNLTVGAGMVIKPLQANHNQHAPDEYAGLVSELTYLLGDTLMPDFEAKLNVVIRKHFPHWRAKEIDNDQ